MTMRIKKAKSAAAILGTHLWWEKVGIGASTFLLARQQNRILTYAVTQYLILNIQKGDRGNVCVCPTFFCHKR